MAPDREARLEELFAQLVPLSPERSKARLDSIGSEDPELRRELQALLDADTAASLLDDPIHLDDFESAEDRTTEAGTGQFEAGHSIGPYRIIRTLGSGGMGDVYLAQQEEPVQRQVAIKVVRSDMGSREVLMRFEAERQALALLESPHVARIVDVGTSDDGRAFFALEYVDGIPITDYCERHDLTLRERLRLFLQVCKGVEDAHQRGVIHRDIKPMNILVASDRQEAVVKIIDFGIAKMTQHSSGQTIQGMVLGTPDYMSPEQAESGGRDIDTRSDVYSAGIVLFELLVGDLPHDRQALREMPYFDAIHDVATRNTPKPSERAATLDPPGALSLQRRGLTNSRLQRMLRGELDWICLRALERDRARRYQSIAELAADIRRYLAGEPVLARSPSLRYRIRKFASRNRGAVAATAIVLFVLFAAAVTSTVFYLREQGAHQESLASAKQADAAKQQSERAAEFLRCVLVEINAVGASGEPQTLEDAIVVALTELENAGLTAKEAASAKHSIGTILTAMRFRSMAKLVFESALQDFADAGDANTFDYAHCLLELASLRTRFERDPAVTKELVDQALQLVETKLEQTSYEVVVIRTMSVGILERAQEHVLAEKLLRESLKTFHDNEFVDDQPEAALTQHRGLLTLSQMMRRRGRLAEALELLMEADPVARQAGLTRPLDRLLSHRRRALLLVDVERYDEAVVYFDSTLSLIRQLRGETAIASSRWQAQLGLALAHAGRFEAAETLLVGAIARCDADPACVSAQKGHLDWLWGEFHRLGGEWSDALEAYDGAQAQFDIRWPRGRTRWHAQVMQGRGLVARKLGELDAAALLLTEACDLYSAADGAWNPGRLRCMHALVEVLMSKAQFEEAEALAKESFEGHLNTFGEYSTQVADSRALLIRLYQLWGRDEAAKSWMGSRGNSSNAMMSAGR